MSNKNPYEVDAFSGEYIFMSHKNLTHHFFAISYWFEDMKDFAGYL